MHLHRGFQYLLVLGFASAFAADRYPVDWKQLQPEILDYYSALIRIDTTNPPGNETQAVSYLKAILDREGIPNQVLALDPKRANLVARIKGNGSKRPILVMGHTDTVGIQREKWPVDPFSALRKDGFIWGRGSSDDKSHVAADLAIMLLLKRNNVALDRDVIFVAEAGEEGSTGPGIDFLVNQHWPDIEAEYALAEGGYVNARNGKARYVEITTTEKTPHTTRLIARGTAGHGSRPRVDNPLLHLAAAVSKFAAWQPSMRLNDTTRAYFERLALVSAPDDAWRFNHIADPAATVKIQHYLAEHDPGNFSVLRTSIVPTIISAGFRSNVIPSEGEATLDIRTLPDEDMARLYEEMRKAIADPSVEIVPLGRDHRQPSPPSRLDTEMFQALERTQKRMYPGAITLPAMLTGATDMAQLRVKGVQAYGFGPKVEEDEVLLHGPHSDQERLAEPSLYEMVEFLWYSVLDIAAAKVR
jgi:acetylornithine deacetylase/succinyl-diaminopimelate desuccinylase-like protein